MPSVFGPFPIENWARRELEYMGVKSLANIGGAVRLKAKKVAKPLDCDIYVVVASNARI